MQPRFVCNNDEIFRSLADTAQLRGIVGVAELRDVSIIWCLRREICRRPRRVRVFARWRLGGAPAIGVQWAGAGGGVYLVLWCLTSTGAPRALGARGDAKPPAKFRLAGLQGQ